MLKLWSATVLLGGLIALAALSYHTVELPLRELIRSAWQSTGQRTPRPPGLGTLQARWAVLAMVVTLAGTEAWRVGVFHPIPPLQAAVGEELTRDPTFEAIAGEGWSQREDWGIWSTGQRSNLTISVPRPTPPNLRLLIKGSFYLVDRHPSVNARVTANGVEIGVLTADLAHNVIDVSLPLPTAVLASSGGVLKIDLLVDNPASPQSLGMSEDARVLGFGLKSLRLSDDKPS